MEIRRELLAAISERLFLSYALPQLQDEDAERRRAEAVTSLESDPQCVSPSPPLTESELTSLGEMLENRMSSSLAAMWVGFFRSQSLSSSSV